MVLAVPPDSPIIDKARKIADRRFPFIETKYWANEPFILAEQRLSSGKYVKNLLQQLDISPPVVLEIRDISKIILAVRHGIGNAIIPSIPQDSFGANLKLVYLSIDYEQTPLKIAVVTQKGKRLSEPEQELISLISENYNKDLF